MVFRADASLEIGTGHIMRCLTLAEGLRDKGANCRFISREHLGNMNALIHEKGFEVHSLPVDHSYQKCKKTETPSGAPDHYDDWLGTDWKTDAQQVISSIQREPIDWIIVDHYGIDARWESILNPHSNKFMVIDDLANRRHDCDLLLDQNLGRFAENYLSLVPQKCEILVGPQFALLRNEFAEIRKNGFVQKSSSRLLNLLIMMGGVDLPNSSGQVLQTLLSCDLPEDLKITVVVSSKSPWVEDIREQANQMPWVTKVLVDEMNLSSIMFESDLAIGAAGSSAWERCCVGLPTLLVVLAENQTFAAKALVDSGCNQLIGGFKDIDKNLGSTLEIMKEPINLLRSHEIALSITDGNGTNLIVQKLFGWQDA